MSWTSLARSLRHTLISYHSPQSVSVLSGKENDTLGELDEATRLKAETIFSSYYQTQSDPHPDVQGLAPFN